MTPFDAGSSYWYDVAIEGGTHCESVFDDDKAAAASRKGKIEAADKDRVARAARGAVAKLEACLEYFALVPRRS